MLARVRPRLSYANVASTLAITLALGGGAFAATKLVGVDGVLHGCVSKRSAALRVVVAGKACRHSETAVSWNQQGRPGLPGTAGAPGAPGQPGARGGDGAPATRLWAAVSRDGKLLDGTATAASENSGMSNVYDVTFAQEVSHCVAVASPGFQSSSTNNGGGNSGVTIGTFPGYDKSLGLAPNTVEVSIYQTGTAATTAFQIAVFC